MLDINNPTEEQLKEGFQISSKVGSFWEKMGNNLSLEELKTLETLLSYVREENSESEVC